VIVLDGIKVSPAGVEDVLSRHPDVVESAAFAAPSGAGGSVLAAAVVSRGAFDEQALLQYCRDQLGRHAPQRVFAVAGLPRTTTGKILRRNLPQQVAQSSPGTAQAQAQSSD
jgi:long-chain acyl-CoA synthetase